MGNDDKPGSIYHGYVGDVPVGDGKHSHEDNVLPVRGYNDGKVGAGVGVAHHQQGHGHYPCQGYGSDNPGLFLRL